MHRNGSQILHGAAHLFFAEALLIPTGFVTAVFLARELQPAGYGIFALVTQFVIWTEYLLVSGLENTTVKFLSGSSNTKPLINTVYLIYAGAGCAAALAVILIAPPIALLIKAPETAPLLRLLSLDIPLFALAHAGRHCAVGCRNFRHNAAMRSTYWISRLIFIILFVSTGLSIRGALFGLIAASFSEAVLGFFLVRPAFFRGGFAPLTRFWHFLAPLQLAEINKRLLVQELIVLKALGASAAVAGQYGAAKNLALVPILLSRALKPTLLSVLNYTKHEDESAAREIAVTALRSLFWILPAVAAIAAGAEEIVSFIFGPAYAGAAALFSLLLFAGMGFLVINIGIALFTAWNLPGISVSITWPMLPVAILGYAIGYPAYGAAGIAAATLAAVLIGTLLTVLMLYRRLHLHPPAATVARSCGCAAIIGIAVGLWPVSGVAVLGKYTSALLLSALMLAASGEFSRHDRFILRDVFSRGRVNRTPYKKRP